MKGRRYRKGDIVSVEMKVHNITNGVYQVMVNGAVLYLDQSDMDKYVWMIFAADPNLRPGDRVRRTWDDDGTASGEVIATDGDQAWVRFGGFSAVYPFSELEVVDEGTA